MRRRELLTLTGTGVVAALAGCSDSESTPTATPTEAVTTTAETPTSTPTATDSPTPTPSPTPTHTPTPGGGITADSEPLIGFDSTFLTYAEREAEVHVSPDDMDRMQRHSYEQRVWVIGFAHPINDITVYGYSESFIGNSDSSRTVTVTMDDERNRPVEGENYHYIAFLTPKEIDSIGQFSRADKIAETNRFKYLYNGLQPNPVDSISEVGEADTDRYTRRLAEGQFAITMNGEVNGEPWQMPLSVYKSPYYQKRTDSRPRDPVDAARQTIIAPDISNILFDKSFDYDSNTAYANMVLDMVRGVPGLPDGVSDSVSGGLQYPVETIVTAEGDVRDAAVLCGTVMRAEPGTYRGIFIDHGDHLAVGIPGGRDFSGDYYTYNDSRYYYCEPTGDGMPVGVAPEQYTQEQAAAGSYSMTEIPASEPG